MSERTPTPQWSLHKQPRECMGGDHYEYSLWVGDEIAIMADPAAPCHAARLIEIVEACNNHNRLTRENEDLRKALKSASIQCGNVIYNCEQRPADNDRHLDSWRSVQEYIDAAISLKDSA